MPVLRLRYAGGDAEDGASGSGDSRGIGGGRLAPVEKYWILTRASKARIDEQHRRNRTPTMADVAVGYMSPASRRFEPADTRQKLRCLLDEPAPPGCDEIRRFLREVVIKDTDLTPSTHALLLQRPAK
jgi:hypothetical protein